MVTIVVSCKPTIQDIFLGQGIMAGEATSTSVILQSRLTVSNSLLNGDLAGKQGVARFEIDEDASFSSPISTAFIKALPENDFIMYFK